MLLLTFSRSPDFVVVDVNIEAIREDNVIFQSHLNAVMPDSMSRYLRYGAILRTLVCNATTKKQFCKKEYINLACCQCLLSVLDNDVRRRYRGNEVEATATTCIFCKV